MNRVVPTRAPCSIMIGAGYEYEEFGRIAELEISAGEKVVEPGGTRLLTGKVLQVSARAYKRGELRRA